ncbi:MAG: ribosomal protein S18-alanine N-acetyltransferase [Nitrospirae bacterium]|nr:ribosomal protein S18-alanine N-acetyltransferase [Nitrospirota bacterium]
MDLTIRPMTIDDLTQVLWIEERSFTSAWTRKAFQYELNNNLSICMTACYKGLVIGYVFVQAVFDEAHILKLAIHPEFRRQNVGSLLVAHIVDTLTILSCEKILLEVRRSNDIALRLYEGFGFKKLSVRTDYYIDPTEDAIVMIRRAKVLNKAQHNIAGELVPQN